MGQKTAAEDADGLLDPLAHVLKGACALLLGGLHPAFQPALVWLLGLDPGLVTEEPEKNEVGVELAVHHALEVELDVGLAGQCHVVAEDAQAQAVGYEPPEEVLAAVEELLDEAVGTGPGGTGDAWGAFIQVNIAADEMDRRIEPEVGDGIGLAVYLQRVGGLKAAIAQLLEEDQQPAFPGGGGCRVVCGQVPRSSAE
jgi:hypothetical protein